MGQGGPTTEEGKKKQADAEAARVAKEERRREKNRKKRQAYRERKRGTDCSGSRCKRNHWKKKWNSNSGAETKKSKKKTKDPTNEEEWDSSMKKALKDGDFERMQRLFRLRFEWDTMESFKIFAVLQSGYGQARETRKTYRKLSLKYHPDKNDARNAKLAFQALRQVYESII